MAEATIEPVPKVGMVSLRSPVWNRAQPLGLVVMRPDF